jgi:hypothetical protein
VGTESLVVVCGSPDRQTATSGDVDSEGGLTEHTRRAVLARDSKVFNILFTSDSYSILYPAAAPARGTSCCPVQLLLQIRARFL